MISIPKTLQLTLACDKHDSIMDSYIQDEGITPAREANVLLVPAVQKFGARVAGVARNSVSLSVATKDRVIIYDFTTNAVIDVGAIHCPREDQVPNPLDRASMTPMKFVRAADNHPFSPTPSPA